MSVFVFGGLGFIESEFFFVGDYVCWVLVDWVEVINDVVVLVFFENFFCFGGVFFGVVIVLVVYC